MCIGMNLKLTVLYNPKTAPCVLMNISTSFRTLPSKACAFSKYYTLWWASS